MAINLSISSRKQYSCKFKNSIIDDSSCERKLCFPFINGWKIFCYCRIIVVKVFQQDAGIYRYNKSGKYIYYVYLKHKTSVFTETPIIFR